MRWLPNGPDRPVRSQLAIVLTLALIASMTVIVPALAGHDISLPGSNFEIDVDANLKVDHDTPPSLDWANVNDIKKNDAPSGQNDDSFGQGSKEDTAVPAVVSGSIPPNKSDLKTFGIYTEENAAGKFLHMFWTRVQDPSGTTNMDFEFNQSSTSSANGVTPQRTAGDLLVVYELSKGGTVPELFLFTWLDGTEDPQIPCESANSYPCWGDRTDLDAAGAAAGSINTSPIPDDDSDGLGALDARTFGEASIDLDFIFDEESCQSFGSVYLKSRSSDSFTAALKDFIAPQQVNITNCGTVIIRKQTSPDENPNTTNFGFERTFSIDPEDDPPVNTFTLKDDGVATFNNVLFGTGLTVDEKVVGTGYAFDSVDCSASTGVTPSIAGSLVTFDIDGASDVLDCTYTNRLQVGAIKITKTRKHAASGSGDHAHPGVNFTVDGVTKSTDANGVACFDGLTFGNYNVVETVPAGYVGEGGSTTTVTKVVNVDNVAGCTDDPYGGETVAFSNTPLTDITVSVNSQVDGGTASTISCVNGNNDSVASGSTGANGDGSATANNLVPDTYVCTIVVDP